MNALIFSHYNPQNQALLTQQRCLTLGPVEGSGLCANDTQHPDNRAAHESRARGKSLASCSQERPTVQSSLNKAMTILERLPGIAQSFNCLLLACLGRATAAKAFRVGIITDTGREHLGLSFHSFSRCNGVEGVAKMIFGAY